MPTVYQDFSQQQEQWQAMEAKSFYACRQQTLTLSKNAGCREKGLTLFFPAETDVMAGDRLMTCPAPIPSNEALTVVSVRCFDFGSDRLRHKEVLCQ